NEAKALLGEFKLPESLLTRDAPGVSLMILDGERLYFRLVSGGKPPAMLGGVDIRHPRTRLRTRRHAGLGRLEPGESAGAMRTARRKPEVDWSRIARELGDRLPRA